MNRRRRDAMKSAARRNKKREFDRRKFFKELGSWTLIILIAGILGYSIVQFGGQTITIIGQSMNGVLESGDTVIVSKISYAVSSPKRYDIVAFKLRKSDRNLSAFMRRLSSRICAYRSVTMDAWAWPVSP